MNMVFSFPVLSIVTSGIAYLQAGGFQGQQGDVTDLLGAAAGIFALILFALSTFAWVKRRQTSLILVSVVFFLFFLKIVLEVLPTQGNILQFASVMLDFLILALFFLAIVVKPRMNALSTRKESKEDHKS